MQFDSLAAALAMDGHGVYVWSVVVVSTLIAGALLLLPALAARRFLEEQRVSPRADPQPQAGREAGAERGHDGTAEQAAPVAIIEEVNNASSS